jgi:peptidyl-tRNA hydrolase, PTH1 family
MILAVGLGNPEKKYKNTPHNLGFAVIDFIYKKNSFNCFRKENQALVSQKEMNQETLILAKPLTYMNLSGQAVKKLIEKYEISPEQLWLIHDDADLPAGEIKISFDRGHGGHKGVASVINEIKSKKFNRIRLGISPTREVDLKEFVLRSYRRPKERIVAKKMTREAAKIILEKTNPA